MESLWTAGAVPMFVQCAYGFGCGVGKAQPCDDARATIAACFDESTAGSGELDRCDDDVSCVPDTMCARSSVLANESQGLGWFVEVDKPPSPLELEVIDTPKISLIRADELEQPASLSSSA